MKPLVFIDGDQGTTGLQMRARLQTRDDIELLTLPAAQRKDPAARADALRRADFAVLCLPDDAARDAVALAAEAKVRIVDASSAHRVDRAWTYGLPELSSSQAQRIAQAARVSNPGCYPTGAITLLRPLVESGLLAAGTNLTIHAVSGYSGQGRPGVERHEGPQAARAPAFELYGLQLQHKHVPEIRHHAGLAHDPIFVPGYAHYAQGIVLTVPVHRAQLAGDAVRVHQCLAGRYAGCEHITVMPFAPGSGGVQTLDPQALNGSDSMQLHVLARADGEQVLLAAVFDNLGKGAAGAAVQNLNLMLGG